MILRLTVSQRKLFTQNGNESTSSNNRDIGDGTARENDSVDDMKSRLTVTQKKLFTANENESIRCREWWKREFETNADSRWWDENRQ